MNSRARRPGPPGRVPRRGNWVGSCAADRVSGLRRHVRGSRGRAGRACGGGPGGPRGRAPGVPVHRAAAVDGSGVGPGRVRRLRGGGRRVRRDRRKGVGRSPVSGRTRLARRCRCSTSTTSPTCWRRRRRCTAHGASTAGWPTCSLGHLRSSDVRTEGPRDILDALRMADDLTAASFGKVTCFDSPVPVASIAEQIGPEVGALPSSIPDMGDSAGELYLSWIHKAVGIQTVIDHLGLDREQVVAVGDGLNDIEMLEFAGVGRRDRGQRPTRAEGGRPRRAGAATRGPHVRLRRARVAGRGRHRRALTAPTLGRHG